jgi:hypothetical protein
MKGSLGGNSLDDIVRGYVGGRPSTASPMPPSVAADQKRHRKRSINAKTRTMPADTPLPCRTDPTTLVVSSDYPHSNGAFPEAMQQFLGLPLGDEARRKILWDNCAPLYSIETPAAALSQEHGAASAAE